MVKLVKGPGKQGSCGTSALRPCTVQAGIVLVTMDLLKICMCVCIYIYIYVFAFYLELPSHISI